MYAGVPGAAPPKVPGGPGAQVFANNGCGGCHTLAAANSGGVTGPEPRRRPGRPDARRVEESIVDPNAKIAKGYPPNVMPQNYSRSLTQGNRRPGPVPDRIDPAGGKGAKPEEATAARKRRRRTA